MPAARGRGRASPTDETRVTDPRPPLHRAPVDAALLRDLVGDDLDLMRELIELFRTEGPRLLGLIGEAVDSHDAAALQQAAHALKGSAGSMAARLSTEMARDLEAMGRDSRMNEAPEALLCLERELGRVYEALEVLASAA